MPTVALSGASGFVGSACTSLFKSRSHRVIPITRSKASENAIAWDTERATIDREALRRADVVVHLAGESVVGRWTDEKKRKVRESRVKGTQTISEAMATLEDGPQTLICASAIGYYPANDTPLDETASPGTDFLAEVCVAWERATQAAAEGGIRVVNLRIGLVLGKEGGPLKAMLLPFQMGLGGRLGDGTQMYSWISLTDLTRAVLFLTEEKTVEGPVNAVAPNPATNAEFTKTLGKVIRRPTPFPVPAWALKTLLGEFAKEPLASHNLIPKALLDAGFEFQHTHLHDALAHELG